MNLDQPNDYNPADDDNQGVAQLLSQAEEASNGVSQADYMNPVTAQGPEPIKEEIQETDTDANGVNDDVLAEESVEESDVSIDNDTEA